MIDDPRDATIATLTAEVAKLHERLEDNYVFVWDKATDKMLRQEVEPGSVPDGIECRNDTIKLQDENNERLRAANATLTAALEEARGALEPFKRAAVIIAKRPNDYDFYIARVGGLEDCHGLSKTDFDRARTVLATINAALGRVEE